MIIVILPASYRPEKCNQKPNSDQKADKDQKNDDIHIVLFWLQVSSAGRIGE
jgi:hypothetical protein